MLFTDLELKTEILKALESMGFSELTPVQEQTFAHILKGRDLLAQAETGSGKTSACAIPLIQKIDPSIRDVQALILVPTRELALQYVDEVDSISRNMDISPFAVYGGFSMSIQSAKLKDGVHFLIATPGRLIDHLYNGDLSLNHVKTLVLDEADEMLNMGFIDDVQFIMSCIVSEHQTLLFSATMPEDINSLAESCLKEPVKIELNLEEVAPQNITHYFKFIPHHKRSEAVIEYLKKESPRQAIIFCNSRRNGEQLFNRLKSTVKSLEYIHGGLDQSRRTSIFNSFKKKKIKVLLATDVAGRGLDFSHVTHVINFDFPHTTEIYTHRTGRTGRMGKSGSAFSLVTARDLAIVKKLLHVNRIEPEWDGKAPDFKRKSRSRSGRGAKRYGKKPYGPRKDLHGKRHSKPKTRG